MIEQTYRLLCSLIPFLGTVRHDIMYQFRRLLNQVMFRCIVIYHFKIRSINSYLNLMDKRFIIFIDRVHGLRICLVRQKQMRLGHRLAFQSMIKSIAPNTFTQIIDGHHTQKKNSGCNNCVL